MNELLPVSEPTIINGFPVPPGLPRTGLSFRIFKRRKTNDFERRSENR